MLSPSLESTWYNLESVCQVYIGTLGSREAQVVQVWSRGGAGHPPGPLTHPASDPGEEPAGPLSRGCLLGAAPAAARVPFTPEVTARVPTEGPFIFSFMIFHLSFVLIPRPELRPLPQGGIRWKT